MPVLWIFLFQGKWLVQFHSRTWSNRQQLPHIPSQNTLLWMFYLQPRWSSLRSRRESSKNLQPTLSGSSACLNRFIGIWCSPAPPSSALSKMQERHAESCPDTRSAKRKLLFCHILGSGTQRCDDLLAESIEEFSCNACLKIRLNTKSTLAHNIFFWSKWEWKSATPKCTKMKECTKLYWLLHFDLNLQDNGSYKTARGKPT